MSEAADSRFFIFSCFLAGLIGILIIGFTAFQWKQNINLTWMKAIARSKKIKNPGIKLLKLHIRGIWTVCCEEPYSASFLSGSPIWCGLWSQRLVHVDCHTNLSSESGDICDLSSLKRLILSPPFVKELSRSSSRGILSSTTQGVNEIASTVRGHIRSQSIKHKYKDSSSADLGSGSSNYDASTASTSITTSLTFIGSYSIKDNCNDSGTTGDQDCNGDLDKHIGRNLII